MRNRPIDLGTERGRRLRVAIGAELRSTRVARNLSLGTVCEAVGVSSSTGSRLERGLLDHLDVMLLARYCAVLGLELSVRTYPGGQPIRDVAHAAMLRQFRSALHPSLGWAAEVPLPGSGDMRAWDGLVRGPKFRYGVEAETAPGDAQALLRRLSLKERDSQVDGVLLILRDTHRARAFRREVDELASPTYPVAGKRALELLAVGADPGGSSIITLPRTAGA